MKKPFIAALALTTLAACAQSAPPPEPIVERSGKPYQFTADPGALVAVDIAMQRSLRKDGFAKMAKNYANTKANLLMNARVPLTSVGNNGAILPRFINTHTSRVAMSCDGMSGAVLTLAMDGDERDWAVLTIWNKDLRGAWRWSLMALQPDDGGILAQTELISSVVARCGSRPGSTISAPAVGVDMQVGYAPDQTLSWTSTVTSQGQSNLAVRAWDGTAMRVVLDTADLSLRD